MCNVRTVFQVICFSLIVAQVVDGFSLSQDYNITRIRRQAKKQKCPKSSFACKSGECIDGDQECDGAVDCEDASDESNACHRIKCPTFLFKCRYGACISANLECDGKPDCRDGSDENTPKCRKTDTSSPQCNENEFRCSSGQCISEDDKCDGKADCRDGTDEIRETCWNISCPGFTYRCKYGACVNGNAECNRIVECQDGSDEDPNVCKTSPTPAPTPTPIPTPTPGSIPKGNCVLPPYPKNGKWEISSSGSEILPGSPVIPGTILTYSCKTEHLLQGNEFIFCNNNGSWSGAGGSCKKVCKPILSTSTMKVICTYKDKETENCTDVVDGTRAVFKCATFYEDLSLRRRPIRLCRDGSWDQNPPDCKPVCGQKTVDATTLIVNGTKVNKGDYPWQVALYTATNKQLICGGSLLNQRVILTAAHCVTDTKGKVLSKENYIVAVGKYYRKFDDPRDINEVQFSELTHIFTPQEYRGATQNYLGDIAILVSKKIFALSRRVQPVCVDWGANFDLARNDYGYVTGWGFTTENSQPSEELKELKVPSVSFSQCESGLPEDYDIYLTHDKMCAGYLDKGTSVCKGDSGGGLVFKYDGRYYIQGIVSLSPTSPTAVDGCDSQRYALYTKVATYINDFISLKESEFRP